MDWTANARMQCMLQYKGAPITGPVVVGYEIYRAAHRGDLGGFEAAIDDMLQGIAYVNDNQIISRCYSRKLIDRGNPRVEILVTTP